MVLIGACGPGCGAAQDDGQRMTGSGCVLGLTDVARPVRAVQGEKRRRSDSPHTGRLGAGVGERGLTRKDSESQVGAGGEMAEGAGQ